jgi:pimeloyl-ACP methyl ester carboxylesterase
MRICNKIITLFGLVLIQGCSVFIPKIIPLNNLPAPTGEYFVGTQTYTWTDNSRDEWFTDDTTDVRRIVVQIWYPTNSQPSKRYHYIDKPEQQLGPISAQLELPVFLIKHMQNIKTNSILNAPIHPRLDNLPVIIFSHGLGGMKSQNTIQMEELASRGYFVIAPDHSYDANITIFDDNTFADYRSGITYLQAKNGNKLELTEQDFWDFRLPQLNTRTADIQFILDRLTVLNHSEENFWGTLKLEKIGLIGHSFGGATSIMTAFKDDRIDACMVLDAWLVPIPQYVIDEGLSIPFLFMGRPEWDDALNYEKLDTLMSRSKNIKQKMIIEGTTHFDFSDTPQFSPILKKIGISGSLPADELLLKLNSETVTFFENYLLKK